MVKKPNALGLLKLLRGWPSVSKIVVRPGVPVVPGPTVCANSIKVIMIFPHWPMVFTVVFS